MRVSDEGWRRYAQGMIGSRKPEPAERSMWQAWLDGFHNAIKYLPVRGLDDIGWINSLGDERAIEMLPSDIVDRISEDWGKEVGVDYVPAPTALMDELMKLERKETWDERGRIVP